MVAGRDIIDRLILEGVEKKTAFQWQSQLKQRYANGDATLAIADARFSYQFEYLGASRRLHGEHFTASIPLPCFSGNGPRLVITPLTDRIYVTATQALNLKMGCAPAGPAGTGKTETTKDLANAMAITCYVFNCSPEMDYLSLGNIFKGLSASGTWGMGGGRKCRRPIVSSDPPVLFRPLAPGCFDEFNRLVPEVLSVCSVQFKAVCDGIRAARNTVTIEGDEVHRE